MNYRAVWRPLALVLFLISSGALVPLTLSLFESQDTYRTQAGFAAGILTYAAAGAVLWFLGQPTRKLLLGRKEGLLIVALGWTLVGILGCVPFAVSGAIPSVLNAVFESVSGFTTCGASILTDIESLPRSILLWRALSHWIGGAGVVVLFVAVLPILGISAKALYRVETTSATSEAVTHPRIADTAKTIWLIYVGLTVLQIILLTLGGMAFFDSVCHAFATLATGGFSPRNDSLVSYSGPLQWIVIVFMFLAATNFSLYYQAYRGNWRVFLKDAEFRLYCLLMLGAASLIAVLLMTSMDGGVGDSIRAAVFGVTTMNTCTGFAADDFEQWPVLAQGILVILSIVGGSAGSTAGAIKVVRALVILRYLARHMVLMFRPTAIIPIRVGGKPLSSSEENQIVGFTLLYLTWWLVVVLILMGLGHDFLTSLTASSSCQGCVGPGLGDVGPFDNYAGIHPVGKVVLCIQMIAGRLELMAISVLLVPSFWRR